MKLNHGINPSKMFNLKPCPQCGCEVKKNDYKLGAMCISCEMDLYDDYHEWWCYKELNKNQETIRVLLDLLKRNIEQMKLINGSDDKCIHQDIEYCRNHLLIHETEEAIKLAENLE